MFFSCLRYHEARITPVTEKHTKSRRPVGSPNTEMKMAAAQLAGLKTAGLKEIESGFYVRESLMVELFRNGSFEVFVPFEDTIDLSSIRALRPAEVNSSEGLDFLLAHDDGSFTVQGYAANGNSDFISDDPNRLNEVNILKELSSRPLTRQLVENGFLPAGNLNRVFTRELNSQKILVEVLDGKIQNILRPVNSSVAEKLKGTTITGWTNVKPRFSEQMVPGLAVSNSMLKLVVAASSDGGEVANLEFLEDLNDVTLTDLGSALPAAKQDRSGFKIGGPNPTDLILKLLSLNSMSIARIENHAHEVSGCAGGDPLLARGERITRVMAEDNEKVKQMGLTHQQIALPLLKLLAFIENEYGYHFKMKGMEYEVDNLIAPMCGSLESPFNDGYSTIIMFPEVTNLTTKKKLTFSYLHPYLINQYGFYGSHENRSYVDPVNIADLFGLRSREK